MPPGDPANAHARAPGMLLIPTPDTKCCSSRLTWSSAQCCSFCTVAASAEKVQEGDRWWPDVAVGSCKGTSTRPWAVTHPCTCQEGLAQPFGQMQWSRQLNSNQVPPLLARFGSGGPTWWQKVLQRHQRMLLGCHSPMHLPGRAGAGI